jgi:hypothetical protein
MKLHKILENGRKFWDDNEHRIKPVVHFAGKTFGELANFAQLEKTPTIANYLNTSYRCKEAYESSFTNDDSAYFINSKWEPIFSHEVWPVVTKICEEGHASRIESIKKDKSSSVGNYVCNFGNGLKLGWKGADVIITGVYVSTGRAEDLRKMLRETVWKILKTNCITIGVFKHNWDSYFSINTQEDHDKFIDSFNGRKYSEYIKKFQEKKIGRSLLFYGPPGTGKSSLIKTIANNLNLKTLRLQNLNDIRNRSIVEIVDIFDPEAIVMEDIDHLYKYDISSLLEKIENFNARGKYIFASANEINKLDSALLRPGRFDELIEILHIDEESLHKLTTDEEVINLVKHFPVAFVVEVVKRIEIMGKEEALKNIDDIKKRIECDTGEYKLGTKAP